MPRTRCIRQVLDSTIAQQEVKNIMKLYRAIEWTVQKSVAKEHGLKIHRIIAWKGQIATVIVELEKNCTRQISK